MPTKKRFFTRNKKSVYHSPQDRTSIGNKSVNTRESIRFAKPSQDKKEAQKVTLKVKKETKERKSNFKTPQLPNIPKIITEGFKEIQKTWNSHLSFEKIALLCFFALVFGLSLWQGFLLMQKSFALQVAIAQRNKLTDELGLWEGIVQKYPTYRDAYFQAGILAYRLGDTMKEQGFLEKTLQLDPNYLPAQNLEKLSR